MTTPPTLEQLAELEKLLESATLGKLRLYAEHRGLVLRDHTGEEIAEVCTHEDDANLIVAAVNALPSLLQAARERNEWKDKHDAVAATRVGIMAERDQLRIALEQAEQLADSAEKKLAYERTYGPPEGTKAFAYRERLRSECERLRGQVAELERSKYHQKLKACRLARESAEADAERYKGLHEIASETVEELKEELAHNQRTASELEAENARLRDAGGGG